MSKNCLATSDFSVLFFSGGLVRFSLLTIKIDSMKKSKRLISIQFLISIWYIKWNRKGCHVWASHVLLENLSLLFVV